MTWLTYAEHFHNHCLPFLGAGDESWVESSCVQLRRNQVLEAGFQKQGKSTCRAVVERPLLSPRLDPCPLLGVNPD